MCKHIETSPKYTRAGVLPSMGILEMYSINAFLLLKQCNRLRTRRKFVPIENQKVTNAIGSVQYERLSGDSIGVGWGWRDIAFFTFHFNTLRYKQKCSEMSRLNIGVYFFAKMVKIGLM